MNEKSTSSFRIFNDEDKNGNLYIKWIKEMYNSIFQVSFKNFLRED